MQMTVLEFGRALPDLPPHQRACSTWDVAARGEVRPRGRRARSPEVLPSPAPRRVRRRGDAPTPYELGAPRPRTASRSQRAHHRFRFEEALGHPARPRPAPPCGPASRARRSVTGGDGAAPRGLRRADALHPHRGPGGGRARSSTSGARPAPPDEPPASRARSAPARPWSRCARCCGWSTPAGQAALLAPTEVLAAAALPLDRRRCSASSQPRRPAGSSPAPGSTRVELLTGSMTKAQRKGRSARIATGEAADRGRHPRPAPGPGDRSPTSASSSSTSSTASASSSASRPATDKAGTPPHAAGADRDADPAHGRDDRLRRPRRLHADPQLPAGRAGIQTNLVPLAEHPAWLDRVWERVARGGRRKGRQVLRRLPRGSTRRRDRGRPTTSTSATRHRRRRGRGRAGPLCRRR